MLFGFTKIRISPFGVYQLLIAGLVTVLLELEEEEEDLVASTRALGVDDYKKSLLLLEDEEVLEELEDEGPEDELEDVELLDELEDDVFEELDELDVLLLELVVLAEIKAVLVRFYR